EALALVARYCPGSGGVRDRCDPLPGMKLAPAAPQLAQIALKQRMRIEADAVAVGKAVERVILEQRAQLVDSRAIEPFQRRERRQLSLQRVERLPLVLARVDQHRHSPPERHIAEARRGIF